MPLRSQTSSREELDTFANTEERRRTGRYVAGGAALAITLLAVHHMLLRGASTIAGVCVPAIIMVSYITWILYSACRDRRKAHRLATRMQLTEVISDPACENGIARRDNANDFEKGTSESADYAAKKSQENPAFSSKDEAV